MINEEITQKECDLAVRVGSLAAAELKKALEKCLAKLDEIIKGKPPGQPKAPKDPAIPKSPELKSGKQTLKQLHKHCGELSTVELKDPNLRQLNKAMKAADIDFACVKDGKGSYTLFFKSNNPEEMKFAMKKYMGQMVKTAEKADKKAANKSIKTELKQAKVQAKELNARRDKVKDVSKGARGR